MRTRAASLVPFVVALGLFSSGGVRAAEQCGPPGWSNKTAGGLVVIANAERFAAVGFVSDTDKTLVEGILRRITAEKSKPLVCVDLLSVPSSAGSRVRGVEAVVTSALAFHGGDELRAVWGGGGITYFGWLHEDSFRTLPLGGEVGVPTDSLSVGRLDRLPAPVWLRVESLALSPTRFIQLEQFHPAKGTVRLETASREWLEVCPGGWRGAAPSPDAAWWGTRRGDKRCMPFRAGEPALLPDAPTSDTHYSVLVRARARKVGNVDLILVYRAVDPAGDCFLGGASRTCSVVPRRGA